MRLVVSPYVILALMGAVIVLGIGMMVMGIKFRRLKATYMRMMGSMSDTDLTQALIELRYTVELAQEQGEAQQKQLELIREAIRTMKTRVSLQKFNAFQESGSRQSFSIALLSEELDGIVLTGIHSRDESYMYAKPIEKGRPGTGYKLTPEEEEAINQCTPDGEKPR